MSPLKACGERYRYGTELLARLLFATAATELVNSQERAGNASQAREFDDETFARRLDVGSAAPDTMHQFPYVWCHLPT